MTNMTAKDINIELQSIYGEWIISLGGEGSEFFTKPNCYSNPYYLGVPDDWCESEKKILFIGQEGYGGHWNKSDMGEGVPYIEYTDIEKLQEANVKSVQCRISLEKTMEMKINEAYTYKATLDRRSGFWTSMRTIVNNNGDTKKAACAWTNFDLICHNEGKRRKLFVEERKKLHEGNAVLPVLPRVIQIIKPTHIVLFSWRDNSIDHEFKGITDIKADGKDGFCWHNWLGEKFVNDDDKDKTIYATKINVCGNDIPLLVTYRHPGYGKGRIERDNGFCKAIFGSET